MAQTFSAIASRLNMRVESCAEKIDLSGCGVEKGGCVTKEIIESATGLHLLEKRPQHLRKYCDCLPTRDIAHYNCCPHLCRYCYANYDAKSVEKNFALHDDESPFLIGNSLPDDEVTVAKMESFRDMQLRLF